MYLIEYLKNSENNSKTVKSMHHWQPNNNFIYFLIQSIKHYLYLHKIILLRAFSLSAIGSDYYLAMVLVVVEVLSTVMLRYCDMSHHVQWVMLYNTDWIINELKAIVRVREKYICVFSKRRNTLLSERVETLVYVCTVISVTLALAKD